MENVNKSTLKYDLCIGCGICKTVCPHKCITMNYGKYKTFLPEISSNCTNCGECVKYCPHNLESNINEADKICHSEDPNSFGVNKNDLCFVGFDKNESNRIKSASGGVVSLLLTKLLEDKYIDFIIHAEMISNKIGKPHFKCSLSSSIDEINEKRSSFYGPIDFSEIISHFKGKSSRLVLTGVPCVIRGIKKLFSKHPKYKNSELITISLPCSHNVNGQFIDFLAESLGIDKNTSFKVNLRHKNNKEDANNYYNLFYSEGPHGIETLAMKNRFKTDFTHNWRNYYFAMNICIRCSDFWGYEADISVKDAWGRWAKEPLGQSLVIVRNKKLKTILSQSENLNIEEISFDETVKSQIKTTRYKQVESYNRIIGIKKYILGVYKSDYLIHKMMTFSKKVYSQESYNVSKLKLDRLYRTLSLQRSFIQLPFKVLNKILRRLNWLRPQ